jgi:5-methyltetrahydropteroyltriglutamate--homocysteine methyltransferase
MSAIQTTHTGSLPRPHDLIEMLARRDRGEQITGFDERLAEGVVDIARRQIDAGIAIVNDGEVGKMNYATYIKERLEGFGGQSAPEPTPLDLLDYSEFAAQRFPEFTQADGAIDRPACVGPVRHRSLDAVRKDIERLDAALVEVGTPAAFMNAASPGIIALHLENQYYATGEEYIWALAEAMKPEYDAIAAAGLILQLDCPDLSSAGWHPGQDERTVAIYIEALDHATRDIPPERMRLHLCWGNYEGPHHRDIPLADLISPVLAARPLALSFEAANPRHAHEWRVFEDRKLPDGTILVPGVIDSTTNYVEHPLLVAERIVRYARLVGAENVIAGTDCGFATVATSPTVHPAIAWAKLAALSEGAALASSELAATR